MQGGGRWEGERNTSLHLCMGDKAGQGGKRRAEIGAAEGSCHLSLA